MDRIQNDIIEEFQIFENDMEETLEYLIELGNNLSILNTEYKIDQNKIKGCLSNVWLICKKEDGYLFFEADSDTKIIKGLISLLIKIFSGQTSQNILNSNLYFVEKIGLKNMISSKRISGYSNIVDKILNLAKSYKD
ncbi:MAG: SufE family protein [Bacteroidetes bacterium]|nr:SufE family protein [Bacteroidota bacterium]